MKKTTFLVFAAYLVFLPLLTLLVFSNSVYSLQAEGNFQELKTIKGYQEEGLSGGSVEGGACG